MNQLNNRLIKVVVTVLITVVTVYFFTAKKNNSNTTPKDQSDLQIVTENPTPSTQGHISKVGLPIDKADLRITKKAFGTFVTPKNSPVNPERFSGYHTGVDFEILPGEEKIDVAFYSLCEGPILQKRTASGYGGLLVQSCTIEGQAVTVVYGHARLTSITKKVGDNLTMNEQVGFLGTSGSETDGERKHLHLGIHKGAAINIFGYVQIESDLANWLDFQKI